MIYNLINYNINSKERKIFMKEMLKRGIICHLPVFNELLLLVVLLCEVVDRIKDWRKKKQESSTTEVEDTPDDDEDE